MASERLNRKLAAIFSADVKGYSRLMSEDEVATVRTMTAYRELMARLIMEHRGRVVDATGDNLLAEFGSIVDAVQCAVEVQQEIESSNAHLPENRRMDFRIGINLGDVIEEGERIYGNGVNIAARIEGLAEGGDICISGSAYDQVENKLALEYQYLGEHTVKNIAKPVRMYRVLLEPEAATSEFNGVKRSGSRQLIRVALALMILMVAGAGALMIRNLYLRPSPSQEGLPGKSSSRFVTEGDATVKISEEPTLDSQEIWFQENIIKEFEKRNQRKVILKRFGDDYELVEILRKEGDVWDKNNVSLVKTPLHLTLLLHKEELVKTYEDTLNDLEFNKSEIDSWLQKINNEFDSVALKFSKFSTITGEKLYFLPRKLDTRVMIYRKSKVVDAVKNWYKFKSQINAILKRENGYGLPKNYDLESDVNKWDFYDLLVVGYYWANTEYNGEKTARIAHRSKNYSGTVIGLINRALQFGASQEDICNMHRSSDAIVTMFYWESIFRKYNLYCKGMWQEDGWYGYDIYKGIKNGKVYLAWMHQLDCMLIYGAEHLNIKGFITEKEDLGVSVLPQGVSFELTKDGLPQRTGSREAHTSGWFWGIPKNSPQPELAYKLAMFITSYESHLEESKNFYLIPIRKRVRDTLKADLNVVWQAEVYTKSVEQLKINGDHLVPRFQTLADYKDFLKSYYEAFEQIVINKGYSLVESEDKVDRNFIRQSLENNKHSPFCG
jgi:class 3 adenylate cyclase/ABC-type glycerol-3-phosphate transport system substrate-binding protein